MDAEIKTDATVTPDSLALATLMTLNFAVRQEEQLKMPEHSGSMLRGAFGVALRSLTCITDLPECRLCPLKQHCKFPHIFEAPALAAPNVQVVNPYVIHVPVPSQQSNTYKKGDIWHFSMTIMGAAISEIDIIIKAWQLALRTGLGTQLPYRRATLIMATCNEETLYSLSSSSPISKIEVQAQSINTTSSFTTIETERVTFESPVQLTLQFVTPFRYQQNNRIISHPNNLDSITFIASLYNRIRLCQNNLCSNQNWNIGYECYHEFKNDIASLTIETDISENHVSRRSNRQQRKMQLYGLKGNIHLKGDAQTIARLLPALRLGEKLHIGKNTTMGLGQYKLILMPTRQHPSYAS